MMMGNSSRRELLKAGLALGAVPGQQPKGTAKRVLEPFDYAGVVLKDGRFRAQFTQARNLFLNISNDSLLLGFRRRAGLPASGKPLVGWYDNDPGRGGLFGMGDVYHTFGQYLSGMARMGKAGNDKALLDKAGFLMEEWAKTIEPDGYFFYSRKPHTPHYIYEKTTCGLVDLHQYGGRAAAANHLARITAWAEKNLDRSRKTPRDGCTRSADAQEWYTLGENLYRAYEATGERRFKDFGDVWRYPVYWDIFDSKSRLNPDGFHAYSHVNTFSSLAMTYSVTGEPEYLNKLVKAFDWLEQTQMYASGGFGPGENIVRPDGSLGRWLEGSPANFETVCGSWAGFKMSRYLMMFTGEARYGDWIEKLLYNGVGAALAMKPDGSNFYYSSYQLGGGRKIFHDSKWTCCSGTYTQAIADYHNLIYFHDDADLFVNLYVPSELTWDRSGGAIGIQQETAYPESETTTVTVQPQQATEFALHFRIPRWCEGASLAVNGAAQNVTCRPGTWAVLKRTWHAGDRVSLRLPMRFALTPVDQQHPKRVALMYGPVLLVRKLNGALADPTKGMKPGEGPLEFRAETRRADTFVPFYRPGFMEPYEAYFEMES